MKTALLVLGIALGTSLAMTAVTPRAQAQNYPWCAYYGPNMPGVNCGFTTYQQCMATVSGIGGYCQQNNAYQPPPGPHPRRPTPY